MPRLNKNKVGIYIVINKETNKKLRELIMMKYGEYRRGYLSHEVELAILHWISMHTQIHTNQIVINPKPKAHQVFQQIRRYIIDKYGFLPHQISKNDIVEAISAVRGSDKRTIKKWLNEFLKYKLIKQVAPNIFEIV